MIMIILYAVLFVCMCCKLGFSIGVPSSQPTAAFLASCQRYQETEAEVEAIFTDGDGFETQRMFITNMVTVHSTAPNVASILGRNKIIGNEVGTSEISVSLPNSRNIHVTSDIVVVSDTPVSILDLQVSAITGATSSPATSLDMYSKGMLSFDLYQNLTFDGMTAGISVFANYSDGTWTDVTNISSVHSLSEQLITSVDAYGPILTVNEYAHSQVGGLIEAVLPLCFRDQPLVSTGIVKMDIEPQQVFLTPEFFSLAEASDLAAQPPFSLPTETYLSVSILFRDSNVRNFTDGFLPGLNSRATIEIISGSDLVEIIDGNLLRVVPNAKNGTAVLNVYFPGVYEINGSTAVHVTGFVRTETVLLPYPPNPSMTKNTVYKLDCSDKWQRLQMVATAMLSNGNIVDVTANATFHLNESYAEVGFISTLASGTVIFIATGVGTGYVRTVLGPERVSEWSPIYVVDEIASISRLELSGRAPNDTLHGFSGSHWDILSLTAFFDDGTYYPEIIYGETTEWVQASELVRFVSSNTHAISVNKTGVLTQHFNFFSEIYISAMQHQSCHGQQQLTNFSEITVYSNLKPHTFDFDLGNTVGPKFGTVEIDSLMNVPVSVQAFPDNPLTAFHIILQFDPELIGVDDDASCVGNPEWTGFFECTTNNPPGEVIMAGICGIGGCEAEGLIHFASIRFRPKKQGQSSITGRIKRVEDEIHCVSLQSVFAGSDDVHIDSQGGLISFSPTGQLTTGPPGAPHPTQVPTTYSGNNTLFRGVFPLTCPSHNDCHSCVMGDVNGDCAFDAGDARALEQIITLDKLTLLPGDPSYVSYSSCQQTAMDPNRDGLVDYLDVVFLLRVMTNKYRFLTHLNVEYGQTGGLLIGADLRESNGASINNNSATLSFSLATNQTNDLSILIGERIPTTIPSLVQVQSRYNAVNDQMEINLDTMSYELDFSIAVTVRTFDDLGRSGPKRVFTYYCSPFMDSSGVCVHSLTGARFDGYFTFDLQLFQPSSEPTSAPTESLIYADRFVTLVHPVISSIQGPALPIIDYPKLTALAQWSVPFDTLIGAVPGQESSFGVTITGRQYSSVSFTVPRRPAAVVTGVVKTSQLYDDARTLSVAFQLTDIEGHTQVTDTSLLMVVSGNNSLYSLSATFVCLTPDPISGIGSCSGEVSSTWFSSTETRNLTVRVFTPSVSTEPMPVYLVRSPVRSIPATVSRPFMLMSVPTGPVLPGETFVVEVTADTGFVGISLAAWSVLLSFDAGALEFVGQTVGSAYANATVSDAIPGSVDISCPGTTSVGTGDGSMYVTSGPAVEVLFITMRVHAGALPGLYSGALSLFVYYMLDDMTSTLVHHVYGFIQDHRDFKRYISADVTVASAEIVGVFAYAPQNEMVNTATIDGIDIFSHIHVVGITANSPHTGSTLVTSGSECSVRANATAGMDVVTNSGQKCVIKLSSHKTTGFSKGLVDIAYNQFNASVPFRIWQPQTIKVKLMDAILNSIEPVI